MAHCSLTRRQTRGPILCVSLPTSSKEELHLGDTIPRLSADPLAKGLFLISDAVQIKGEERAQQLRVLIVLAEDQSSGLTTHSGSPCAI